MRIFKFFTPLFFLLFSCDQSNEPIYYPDLTPVENTKLDDMLQKIPFNIVLEYHQRFYSWKATWDWPQFAYCSNLRCYTQSKQYDALLNFCQNKEKLLWPLIFTSYLSSDREYLVALLLEDVTLPEYEYLLNNVQQMLSGQPSEYGKFWLYYIKLVLQDM